MGVKDIKYDIPVCHGGHGHDGQWQVVQATTTGSDMPSALGLVAYMLPIDRGLTQTKPVKVDIAVLSDVTLI